MAQNVDDTSALHTYAQRVLAGTGLTETDAYSDIASEDEGSAAYALQHGWDLARRAAKVVQL